MTANKKSIFDRAMLSTKVKSANVKLLPEGLIGYLIGPFCGLLANSLFSMYLIEYFKNVLFGGQLTDGVNTFLTVFPMVSAILIVAGNLLAGQIIERTKSRAGKARPYILLSSVLLAVVSLLMFIQPIDNKIFKMVWLAVSYNLFYAVAFPLYNTANSALVPVSTRNGKQRGLLASMVNMAVLGGAGAGSIIFPQIMGAVAGALPNEAVPDSTLPSANGYLIIFAVIAVVTFVGCLAQYYFTRERVTEENMVKVLDNMNEAAVAAKKGPSMKEQAKALFSDKFFIVTIIFYFLYQFSGTIKNATMQSYCSGAFGEFANNAMSILGIVGAVPMAVAILFVVPLCNKFGKRPVVFAGMVLGVIGGVIAGIWYDDMAVACVGIALKCLGSAPAGYMILAMLADCLDHIEAKHGFRCDGFGMSVYSAILIAAVPFAQGIGNALVGLGTMGSVAAYIWVETGAYALAGIVVLFFGVEKFIARDRQKILARQKAETIADGMEWVAPEERMRREEEESDRLADAVRISELKAKCEKNGTSFEEEEAKYQAKLKVKNDAAEKKAALKAAKQEEARLRREKAVADAEAARIAALKAKCESNGLKFEEEEAKYQAELQAKKDAAEKKAARKREKLAAIDALVLDDAAAEAETEMLLAQFRKAKEAKAE